MTNLSVLHENLISTSEVAEMLDVHPSSVKRWTSEGALQCVTTSGGHRRFTLENVRKFSEKAGVRFYFAPLEEDLHAYVKALQAPAQELDRGLIDLLFRWLSTGKTDRAEWSLTHLYKTRYTIGGLFDRLLAPLLTRVGEQWEDGKLSVATEHHISQQVVEAMYRLRPQPGKGSGKRLLAVCAAAENVQHFIPLLAARLVLENQGWNVVFLGAAVPNPDLADIIAQKKPNLVCVTFAPPAVAADVTRTVAALSSVHPLAPFELAIGGAPTEGLELPLTFGGGRGFTSMMAFETWVLDQTVRHVKRAK